MTFGSIFYKKMQNPFAIQKNLFTLQGNKNYSYEYLRYNICFK